MVPVPLAALMRRVNGLRVVPRVGLQGREQGRDVVSG